MNSHSQTQCQNCQKKYYFHRKKMTKNESNGTCGIPEWFGIPLRNDPATNINETLAAAVNIPCCIFAFLSNLAIIITIIKKRSLHRPSNTLLCSLAATDCLTGITAQPMFLALRMTMLYGDHTMCSFQEGLFNVYYASAMLTSGWSFVFLTVISFDRHYALSRPLVYHTTATNKGKIS